MRIIDVPGPPLQSSSMLPRTGQLPTPSTTPQPPPGFKPAPPNYNAFASLTGSHPSSRSNTPGPAQPQSHPPAQSQGPPQSAQTTSDPFAALSSPARQPTPSLVSASSRPPAPSPSASSFKFTPEQPAASAQPSQSNGVSTDDEWNFASALPEEPSQRLPSTNQIVVSTSLVGISFQCSRSQGQDSLVEILATCVNNTSTEITEFTLQLAVTKVYSPLPLKYAVASVVKSNR